MRLLAPGAAAALMLPAPAAAAGETRLYAASGAAPVVVRDHGAALWVRVVVALEPSSGKAGLQLTYPTGARTRLLHGWGWDARRRATSPCGGRAWQYDIVGDESGIVLERASGAWRLAARKRIRCWRLVVEHERATVQRRALGGVRVTLWKKQRYSRVASARLRIERRGRAVFDSGVPGWSFARVSTVRDLDGDREPEVVLYRYSGGAHCCVNWRIYDWDGRRYRTLDHSWGNVDAPVHVRDLGRDGRLELVTRDDRFAYAFGVYAGSSRPLRIFRYRRGRLLDVTREFLHLVERDARRWSATARGMHPGYGRQPYAAWMAEQYLLGREREAWPKLRAVYRRFGWGERYLRELRAYLTRLGYVRK